MIDAPSLAQQIAAVAAEHAAAENAAQQSVRRFWDADGALRALHARRREGEVIPSATILAACDARMWAGHIAYPFREAVRQLERWLKTLQHEQEALLRKAGKKPRGQPSLLDVDD